MARRRHLIQPLAAGFGHRFRSGQGSHGPQGGSNMFDPLADTVIDLKLAVLLL
jgi:hypothetical protein